LEIAIWPPSRKPSWITANSMRKKIGAISANSVID
jgi:hypothetical protein